MYKTGVGFDIAWKDLETSSMAEGTGWGLFARTGDAQHAALANGSRNGTKLTYVSTPDEDTAGTIVTQGQLFTVPYGNRKGGTVTEVMGANQAGYKVYYPTFAPDDSLIAYDRSLAGTSSYNDPQGEVFVIPVVVEGAKITTYSALYLWNQPETEDNHSPAWDSFKIPTTPK